MHCHPVVIHNLKSLHERKMKYEKTRAKIFGNRKGNVSKKINRCRVRYKNRKKIKKMIIDSIIESEVDGRMYANIELENEAVFGLLDSGASISVLGNECWELVKKIGAEVKEYKNQVRTADGKSHNIVGFCNVNTKYNGMSKLLCFYLIPNLSQKVYLGMNFWREFSLVPHVSEIQTDIVDYEKEHDFKEAASLVDLSPEQKAKLEMTKKLFLNSAELGLGKTHLSLHVVDTGNAIPIKSRHYPLSPVRQEEVYKELDRMLELDVIEESNSPWCCPLVLVRKPGKVRLCLDFRKVNAVTVKDAYPMPHVDGLLSRIKDTHYISGIDLKDAYWQIPLEEKSRPKTAFAVPGRPLYQFKVMPFGLSNAAQTLCRTLDKVLPSRLRDNVFLYLDDLLVCTEDFESHIKILNEVAMCLRKANLTINLDKSKFCMREIKYLGFIVGHGTLQTDPEKIEAMVNFTVPNSQRQVRRFLGLTGWYRRFIKNYSDLAAPLTDCLRKKKI